MIGLERGVVRLAPYTTAWERLFAEEKARLQAAVGDYILDIQHVGSTSIPGMVAKPIIDIAIAVRSYEEAFICVEPIERLGYEYKGEFGIPRRRFFIKGHPRTAYHVHMNELGSRDWENQILFRDYLIQHPEAAQEYAALKAELALKFPNDREAYTNEKGPLVERVLRLARSERSTAGGCQMIQEITVQALNPERFIREKVHEIRDAVGDGLAINALSGGVDSSTVTMLGHRALGERLKTVFINNGLMREGESEQVVSLFQKLGVKVTVVDARREFFAALKGVTDPEEKREAITQTFYRDVFGRIVRESGARCLLQGTILTDVDETVAGIKRQHNVFAQLGIDPQEAFGYRIIEPLVQLRKDGVRVVGKALGLPAEQFERIPFPGPALAARVIGEATPERIETVRKATAVVERLLKSTKAFQYLAILHEDRVTGVRDGKRDFGQQIEVRCWESVDARSATPTRLSFEMLEQLASEIIRDVQGIVSVTYSIAPKPPSTIEAV